MTTRSRIWRTLLQSKCSSTTSRSQTRKLLKILRLCERQKLRRCANTMKKKSKTTAISASKPIIPRIGMAGVRATRSASSWWDLPITCAVPKSSQCKAWSRIRPALLPKLAQPGRSIGAPALPCRKNPTHRGTCRSSSTITSARCWASTLRSRSSIVITCGSTRPSWSSSFRGDAQTRTCVIPCRPSQSITVCSTGRLHTFRKWKPIPVQPAVRPRTRVQKIISEATHQHTY